MPLKKSHGNMYDWVTHMHTHLGGECPHKCSYCYVGRGRDGRPEKYSGPPRLIEKELEVDYGRRWNHGLVIFIEHMNDLFAEGIPDSWIHRIIAHCRRYPGNQYVWQTKNPVRALSFMPFTNCDLIGTTIETNRDVSAISQAPPPELRYIGIKQAASILGQKVFVTIEPILDFDVPELVEWMRQIKPEFVNIGADSKGCGLVEPPWGKVEELIAGLTEAGVTIRKKSNLDRLAYR